MYTHTALGERWDPLAGCKSDFFPVINCTICGSIEKKILEDFQIPTYGIEPITGEKLQITEKIMCCSECKIKPYCSEKCQRKDWKNHKINCIKLEKNISISDVLQILKENKIRTLPGKGILKLDAERKYLSWDFLQESVGTTESKLHLDLNIDGQLSGSYNFLVCCHSYDLLPILCRVGLIEVVKERNPQFVDLMYSLIEKKSQGILTRENIESMRNMAEANKNHPSIQAALKK